MFTCEGKQINFSFNVYLTFKNTSYSHEFGHLQKEKNCSKINLCASHFYNLAEK